MERILQHLKLSDMNKNGNTLDLLPITIIYGQPSQWLLSAHLVRKVVDAFERLLTVDDSERFPEQRPDVAVPSNVGTTLLIRNLTRATGGLLVLQNVWRPGVSNAGS